MEKNVRRRERCLIGQSWSGVAMDTTVLRLLPHVARLIPNLGHVPNDLLLLIQVHYMVYTHCVAPSVSVSGAFGIQPSKSFQCLLYNSNEI